MKNYFRFILQDSGVNKGNTKGRMVSFFFRIANYCRNKKVLKIVFAPYLLFYKVWFEWLLGIEIPYRVIIGEGLKVLHGQSLVINENVIIGKNCTLRHCTTIGNNGSTNNCPQIGDNVDVGANVCIIGGVIIGNNVKIGAGSVVTKNVPDNSVVVGNPAKVIRQI